MVELFIHNLKQIRTERDVLDFDDRIVYTYKLFFVDNKGQETKICCFSDKIINLEAE